MIDRLLQEDLEPSGQDYLSVLADWSKLTRTVTS